MELNTYGRYTILGNFAIGRSRSSTDWENEADAAELDQVRELVRYEAKRLRAGDCKKIEIRNRFARAAICEVKSINKSGARIGYARKNNAIYLWRKK